MNRQDLDRIRFVTRHFEDLQGLYWMGQGLLFFSIGLNSLAKSAGVGLSILSMLLLVPAMYLTFRKRSYYRTRFGEIESKVRMKDSQLVLWGVAALALVVVLAVASGRSGLVVLMDFPLNMMGALFLGIWCYRGLRLSQAYYLALGLMILSAPFILPPWANPGMVYVLVGASLMLAGLLDHWQLVQALGGNARADFEPETSPQLEGDP
jgi:hypothetical protein